MAARIVEFPAPAGPTPTDAFSSVSWSPVADHIAAGTWDGQVLCWEALAQGNTGLCSFAFEAPVLSTCWASTGNRVYAGLAGFAAMGTPGAHQAMMWDLESNTAAVCAAHASPIKEMFFCEQLASLVTGSWDGTVKFWDHRSQEPWATLPLPDRCYAMDSMWPLLVVGCAERHVVTYDLAKLAVAGVAADSLFSQSPSPLKFQTRCVAVNPHLPSAYAIGSIEGRVGYLTDMASDKSAPFFFKCHRKEQAVYAVNAMHFNPAAARRGELATCGSDGTVGFWDLDTRKGINKLPTKEQSITAGRFNAQGTMFAYAVSYDWHKGADTQAAAVNPTVFVHHRP
eukprot:c14257_g1_i1.p1 GENE.c14257_g1_i1~~c14257_g1_i1.p1  ORF type:complete len:397 (+),score=55.28 c14257_g1_i1:173-1192(+)